MNSQIENFSPVSGVVRFINALPPARVFCWLGGISLFLMVLLVPPFEVPDEPQHFFRSYLLSKGEVRPHLRGDVTGFNLPASLPAIVARFMGTSALHANRVLSRHSLVDTLEELKRPLEPESTAFVGFFPAANYSPVQYIPQALAIAMGRILGFGPLTLFYLARLANALFAWILTYIAIRISPVGGRFALLVALLPMTQLLMSSCSPDAMTIASALLFTSVLTRFLIDGSWSRAQALTALLSGVGMCSIKIVFIPFLFSGLGVLFRSGRGANSQIRRIAWQQLVTAILSTALIGAWLWSAQGTGHATALPEGVDANAQLAFLRQDPHGFFRLLARTFYFEGGFYWDSMIGILGWLNLRLPDFIYQIAALAFPLAIYAELRSTKLQAATLVWMLSLVVLAITLTELALYLIWTPVGGWLIEGVQGRYFIPILPFVGVCAASLFERPRAWPYAAQAYMLLTAIILTIQVVMHITIVRAYGIL